MRFFNSQNLLANFTEHTRTLRLYPRPVVAFQINSFLRSRPRNSVFLDRFARTQAVEFLAEWALTPSNVAFLRVHTGVVDPQQVGDKAKWFAHNLEPIHFTVWDEGSSLSGALKAMRRTEQPTGESFPPDHPAALLREPALNAHESTYCRRERFGLGGRGEH